MNNLLSKNEKYKKEFEQNYLFNNLNSNNLEKFLDYFHIWSQAFQEMVVKRVKLSESATFRLLAQQHLEEELGHDVALAHGRTSNAYPDPELKSLCEWFPRILEELNDLERVVLIHLVVEGCASVFYQKVTPLFKGHPKERHFIEHQHADARHDLMGLNLLDNHTPMTYLKLEKVQSLGWNQINLMMARIGHLIR